MSTVSNSFQYVSQSNISYTVTSPSGELLRIPKPYALEERHGKIYNFQDNFVKLAALGLPLGGLLTLILCPLVIWNNVSLLRKEPLTKDDRVHAGNAIIICIIFFLFGIGFFSLFIMHLVL